MARSKDVLAVMGMLCVNRDFRAQFFDDPRSAATYFVGSLTDDELAQIDNLGGRGTLPDDTDREAFISRVNGHFDQLFADYNCPDPPCPFAGTSSTSYVRPPTHKS